MENFRSLQGIAGKAFPLFCFLIVFLWVSALSAQDDQYQFVTMDTTEQYKSTYFCRTLNYYWDQGVADREGNIHFVIVDAYKLYLHSSSDGGQTWVKQQIITGMEGHVYSAMMGITHEDQKVICFSTNPGFNNGSVGYTSEFTYDLYGAVEGEDGWEITPLSIHSSNNGLLPYGIITIKQGTVHCVLYKYGWYNYGGELYEAIYDPIQNSWSELNTIRVFDDRGVDNSTHYVGKMAEGRENEIVLVYQRSGSISGKYNVEVVMKQEDGWQEPQVLLENNHYSTYNRFDIDYDRHGSTYLGYFEPWGENGPQMYLAYNSISNFEMYELFEPTDTLIKMCFHPYMDGTCYIYCAFKNELPRVLQWSEEGLVDTDYLPSFGEEDSTDVKRFHYNIPRKNNFLESFDFLAFTNRYNGKEGDYVMPYELVFVRADLIRNTTGQTRIKHAEKSGYLYPNPVSEYLGIKGDVTHFEGRVTIMGMDGRIVMDLVAKGMNALNVSGLSPGAYYLKTQGTGVQLFIKK